MYNGIPISETQLLIATILFSVFFLVLIVGGISFAMITRPHKVQNDKTKVAIEKLKHEALHNPQAQKRLIKLQKKQHRQQREVQKSRLPYIGTCFFIFGVAAAILLFAVIPGWVDYTVKDYTVYYGSYEVHRYTRGSYIRLQDGTQISGHGELPDGEYTGTIVYAKRMRIVLGQG